MKISIESMQTVKVSNYEEIMFLILALLFEINNNKYLTDIQMKTNI